jgi:hypothetical protein
VNPARANVVHRAVNLIGPDEESRVACVNAVYLAFFEMKASDDDLRRMYHHGTKPAKIGLDRLPRILGVCKSILITRTWTRGCSVFFRLPKRTFLALSIKAF